MDKEPQKPILIVDDQPEDQAVLCYHFEKLSITNPLVSLSDGHDAIRYLNGDGPYRDRVRYPFPAAMFLDLQMPLLNGWEVLDWIQGVGMKGEMKLFIHSTPKNVEEINHFYELGADSFLKKPLVQIDLVNLLLHFPGPWKFNKLTGLD